MNRWKAILKEKKGAFSILWVIAILIATLILTGFLQVYRSDYVLNEVQSIMDTAGVSALQTGVDQNQLRAENFVFSKSTAISEYENLVYQEVPVSSNIPYRELTNVNIQVVNSEWGLGVTSKQAPQAILSSEMVLRMKSNKIFDLLPGVQKTYYDSFSGQYFTVTFNGVTGDGEVELLVRSVTRIVYA